MMNISILLVACYILTFVLAFYFSTREFGKNNWPRVYTLLYTRSTVFIGYGIIYGAIAICLFIYFSDKSDKIGLSFLSDGGPKLIGTALICGFASRALLGISFYDSPSAKSPNKLNSFGTKYVKDTIEEITREKITIILPREMVLYLEKKIGLIEKRMTLIEIKGALIRLSKDEFDNLPDIKKVGIIEDINRQDTGYELSRWIVNKWNIEYYASFIKYCNKRQ
jgi:hypothetical protein